MDNEIGKAIYDVEKCDTHWNRLPIVPNGQNRQKKQFEEARFLLIRHLKYSVKSTLLQIAFSAILPTG